MPKDLKIVAQVLVDFGAFENIEEMHEAFTVLVIDAWHKIRDEKIAYDIINQSTYDNH